MVKKPTIARKLRAAQRMKKAMITRAKTGPKRQRVRRRRTGRVPKRIDAAIQPKMKPGNSFEPGVPLRARQLATYSKPTKDYSSLPPELQFQLTRMAPDEFDSPFVENGVPLDLPHQKLVGVLQVDVPVAATDTTNYFVILNPGAATGYVGNAPVTTFYRGGASVSTVITDAQVISGNSISTVFGTGTYYDKIKIWAAVLDIEILALQAQINGVVHIGSIPLASFSAGVTAAQLIAQADTRMDLKDPAARVLRLRSGIQNRGLIHRSYQASVTGWSLDDCRDEYVSYAIIANAQSGMSTNTPLAYSVTIGVTARALWWPEGSQPIVKGLASTLQKDISPAPMTPVDTENAQMLEKTSHVWGIPNNLTEIVKRICTKQNLKSVLSVVERFYPAIGVINSLLDEAPALYAIPFIQDDIALIDLNIRLESKRLHFTSWSPEAIAIWDELEFTRDELLAQLESDEARLCEKRAQFESFSRRQRMHHGKMVTSYYDKDGIEVDVKALLQWETPTEDMEKVEHVKPIPRSPEIMDGFVSIGKKDRSRPPSVLSGR